MKKFLAIFVTLMFIFSAGAAVACWDCPEEGSGEVQSIDDVTAEANPFKSRSRNVDWAGAGGTAEGNATTVVNAKGDVAAKGEPKATGTATVPHFTGSKVDTPTFKEGRVGAAADVYVKGSGWAFGDDSYRYGPDYARIDIDLSGDVSQGTYGSLGDGFNGFGADQASEAHFTAKDSDTSYGYGYHWEYRGRGRYCKRNNDAYASDWASGTAEVAGGQYGFNKITANSASGLSKAWNTASWDTNSAPCFSGNVAGNGTADFVATKEIRGLGFGQVSGSATFGYSGRNHGAGHAFVKGITTINSGPTSTTVTSHAYGEATGSVGGGGFGGPK